MLNHELFAATRRLNEYFLHRESLFPTPAARRRNLRKIAAFSRLQRLSSGQISMISQGRPLVAVDGSRAEYGGIYPYKVGVVQALAKSSQSGEIDRLRESGVYCPLEPDLAREVTLYAEQHRLEDDEAYRRLLGEKMAHMEIRLALQALRVFKPFMLMLDGGFLLFDRFPEWGRLVDESCAAGSILVGVIEEVATSELTPRTGLEVPGIRVYDREFLYGLLDEGEAVVLSGDNAIKRNYSTVFARLASRPQAVACDFLAQQTELVGQAMNIIYSLTPSQGRGIPSWLDFVDREVRLTRQAMETVIKNGLDPAVTERFFTGNRQRRGL